MSLFALPAQQMIYTRLTTAMPTRTILDDVPNLSKSTPNADFPFIVIGEDLGQKWDTDDQLGGMVQANMHVWSRYPGKKEVKEIFQEIYNALDRQAANLTATGYRCVDCLFEYSNVFDENDGATRHGVCRYRLTIEKE